MKRQLVAFLLVILGLFSLFACENVEYLEPSSSDEVSDESSTASDSNEREPVEERDFRILTSKPSAYISDESSPKVINKAIEKRNALLLENYGARIKTIEVAEKNAVKTLKDAITAGNDICEMLSFSAETSVTLYTSKLLFDFNLLPEFDIESDLFDGEFSKKLATNSTLFLIPDVSTASFDQTYVLFYNRDLVEKSGAENPETLALQGKWTWDKFNEIARKASNVYYKSSADLKKDIFGYSAYYDSTTYPMTMWASCDEPLVKDSYKNKIELSSADINDAVNIALKLRNLYNTRGKYAYEGDRGAKAFEEGRIVFFCNKITYLYALRDGSEKGSNFGFLPLPKLKTEQDGYKCLLDNEARVVSIPKTLEKRSPDDQKYIGQVISAMSDASRGTVDNAFLNFHVAQYLNNNDETLLFKTILESKTFDFGTVYGSGIREVRNILYVPINDYLNFGSAIRNSFSRYMNPFKRYVAENFN